MKTGDTIELTDDQIKALAIYQEELHTARIMFHEAGVQLSKRGKNYWNFIYELYPELKEWEVNLIDGKRIIVMTRKDS